MGRNDHQQHNTPTYNRLHQIIVRREAREGRLQNSIINHTLIFESLVNSSNLYNNIRSQPFMVPVFHQPQPETLNFHPNHFGLFSHSLASYHLNNNIVQPSSFAPLFDINHSASNISVTSISAASLPPPPPGTNTIPFPSTSAIRTEVNNIIQQYRTTNSSEILPPRFNPSHPPPSGLRRSSQLLTSSQPTSHQSSFTPTQQNWNIADFEPG